MTNDFVFSVSLSFIVCYNNTIKTNYRESLLFTLQLYLIGNNSLLSSTRIQTKISSKSLSRTFISESGSPILIPPVALGEEVECNGSAGKSSVGNNILIVDDQGSELPDGEFGQIVAK